MNKILVVDDDKLMRESLAKALADRGYSVTQAGDGEEAYAAVQADVPELLITDVVMPKLDGIGLLQKIRGAPWGQNIKVIVLTIKDTDIDNVNQSLETGIVAYLSKADITREQVVTLVDQQLGNT